MGRKKKKMKKVIITDADEDMISNLPESMIHHILSFLLMEDVVRTCMLSRRWRDIWKSVPVLNFGYDFISDEFIDQFLIHYEGQKAKTLQVDLDDSKNAHHLESWVRFAVMHGVEELDLSAGYYDGMLPSCLFECLEMRVLRLRFYYCCSPQPFHFALLTELHIMELKSNYFDTSASPLLEVLILNGIYSCDCLEIYAPNPKLRYLDISEPNFDYDDSSRLTLYAPNVLHFEFDGSFRRFYEFKDISSVKTLNLYSSVDLNEYRMAESLVNLLRNLTHVNSLKLCQTCILILGYGETNGLEIPSLGATCLELHTNLSKSALVGITSLLRASRCIERLIIKMEDPYIPCRDYLFLTFQEKVLKVHDIDAVKAWESLEHALSVDLPLNTILIQNYQGYSCFRSTRESEPYIEKYCFVVKLVEILLKSSKMLEKMNISNMNPPSQLLKLHLLYGLTKKLLVFPRASPKAKVYFS